MANTPSLNDSKSVFRHRVPRCRQSGQASSPVLGQIRHVLKPPGRVAGRVGRHPRSPLPPCRGAGYHRADEKRGLRHVMAWLQLLPVAFVAILGLVALYALSSGPARL
jgi:hypothetical protein